MARDTLRSQLGPFAMVPIWVLEATHDATAIHLYAILSRYANRERRAWPKQERLAADLQVSGRSLRRALNVLRTIKAVETAPRRRPDGAVEGTEFVLMVVPVNRPPVATSRPPLVATRGRVHRPSVATINKEEPDPLNQIQINGSVQKAPMAPTLPLIGPVCGAYLDPNKPDEAFVIAWNDATADSTLRPVTTLTPKRRRLIRARLVERSTAAWRSIMQRLAASSFCQGEKGWVATFDWVIASPDPAVRALEGQYDDHFSDSELQAAAHARARAFGRTCLCDPRCSDWRTCPAVRAYALKLRALRAS